jgi:hypothetical protein
VSTHVDIVPFFQIQDERPIDSSLVLAYCKIHSSELMRKLYEIVSGLVEYDDIESDEEILRVGPGQITHIGALGSYDFDFSDSEPISENALAVPFHCNLEIAKITVSVPRAHYSRLVLDSDSGLPPFVSIDTEVDLHVEAWAAVSLVRVDGQFRFDKIDIHRLESVTLAEA